MLISSSSYSSALQQASSAVAASSERVASGSRINRASDDAAGAAISNRLSAQISGFSQSIRNANDGVSMLQTANAGLSSLSDGIQRIRELALQSANGTLSAADRKIINTEAQQIKEELSRTVESSQFNKQPLLKGGDAVSLQVGSEQGGRMDIALGNMEQALLDAGLNELDLSTAAGASSALDSLDQMQDQVNSSLGDVGAGLNRLSSTIETLSASEVSAQAARSRIQDADMAKEISELTANRIKEEIALAMQAKANANKGQVLALLKDL